MITRRIAVVALLSIAVACSSSNVAVNPTPIAVSISPLGETSVPEARWNRLTLVNNLLPATIADDFARTIGPVTITDSPSAATAQPFVTVTLAQDTYSQRSPMNDVRSDQPIVWFRLEYTVTAGGVTSGGSIPVYGPEPSDFESSEQQQRSLVRKSVIELRRAVLTALTRTAQSQQETIRAIL